MKQLEFKVRTKTFIVEEGDCFIDNGSSIQFLPINRNKLPNKRKGLMSWKPSVYPKPIDWKRMMPLLTKTATKDANVFLYILK